ncbi:hypothetical protein [Flavobacterium sp.]|uniref:hypothetical protein n=1 Tax=Flavobacterium sp. TaxID=239 RepID=UPI003B9A9076
MNQQLKKALRNILIGFSYVFHPLFTPLFAVTFYDFFIGINYPAEAKYLFYIQIILVTVLIPLTVYFLLRSYKKVESIMLANVNQRKMPLAIHGLLVFILLKNTVSVEFGLPLYYFFLGTLISTLLALMATFLELKVSLHLTATSGLATFAVVTSLFFQVNLLPIIVLLVFSIGAVATSRLLMKAHTPSELLAGLIVGTAPQLLLLFWF